MYVKQRGAAWHRAARPAVDSVSRGVLVLTKRLVLMATTQDEIIAAAAKVFSTRGSHAATVQDIADSVGILKGSLYHHVGSEEELLDVQVASCGLLGMLNWPYKWYDPEGRLTIREVADQLASLALGGLAAPRRRR